MILGSRILSNCALSNRTQRNCTWSNRTQSDNLLRINDSICKVNARRSC